MAKRLVAVFGVFALLIALVVLVGFQLDAESALEPISVESLCPVAGCAGTACHGFDAVPPNDGSHEMMCPEAGCASSTCHAWEALTSRYHRASDASLNVWLLMPVVLVGGLVALMRRLSRPKAKEEAR